METCISFSCFSCCSLSVTWKVGEIKNDERAKGIPYYQALCCSIRFEMDSVGCRAAEIVRCSRFLRCTYAHIAYIACIACIDDPSWKTSRDPSTRSTWFVDRSMLFEKSFPSRWLSRGFGSRARFTDFHTPIYAITEETVP